MCTVNGSLDLPTFHHIPFHLDPYRGHWYTLRSGGQNSTYLAGISDTSTQTCDEFNFADGSQLLKATLTETYTSLRFVIRVGASGLRFGSVHPDCDKSSSLLMAHDSSRAIADGLTCRPFCEVPTACQISHVNLTPFGRFIYKFICRCTAQDCTDLFISLRPELNRTGVVMCDIRFWDN